MMIIIIIVAVVMMMIINYKVHRIDIVVIVAIII